MNITYERIPGGYEVRGVTTAKERAEFKGEFQTVLIQSEADILLLATAFCWNKRRRGENCAHRGTDGSIRCPECGKPAIAFFCEARYYLDIEKRRRVADPGYFEDF